MSPTLASLCLASHSGAHTHPPASKTLRRMPPRRPAITRRCLLEFPMGRQPLPWSTRKRGIWTGVCVRYAWCLATSGCAAVAPSQLRPSLDLLQILTDVNRLDEHSSRQGSDAEWLVSQPVSIEHRLAATQKQKSPRHAQHDAG